MDRTPTRAPTRLSRRERRAQGSSGYPERKTLELDDEVRDTVATPRLAVSELDLGEPGARYADGPVIGTGGMGKVMLARDARIGRDVAVKQLHDDCELEPAQRARFLREARVQGQLEHPSIVPVYDIDHRRDGAMFFTMRRIVGHTLNEILDELRARDAAEPPRYTQRELLTAFATVCLTIDYAHSRGVVHRDLKPANIMLGDFGEVYVLDWGLAQLLGNSEPNARGAVPRLSMPGQLIGTLRYMAPEQMHDDPVGPTADVFALGAILFEILTLCPLRTQDTLSQPIEARPSVRAPELGIAPELEAALVAATESSIERRTASPRELHAAVTRYLDGDRANVQHSTLAAHHAQVARQALARAGQPGSDEEAERAAAMTALVRALALDPSDAASVAALAQLLAAPPRVIPAAVQHALDASADGATRMGARASVIVCLVCLAFLPVLIAIGIRDRAQVAFTFVPIAAALAAGVAALIKRSLAVSLELLVVVCLVIGAVGVSGMFGPLVWMPTILAIIAIGFQVHPSRALRTFAWMFAAVALIVPNALQLAGVIPSSYEFVGGRMLIVPHMIELSRHGAIGVLLGGSLAITIVPCVFISRMRGRLAAAERRTALQLWRFQRLLDALVNV